MQLSIEEMGYEPDEKKSFIGSNWARMTKLDALRFFSNDDQASVTHMVRLEEPRIIWINQRVMHEDEEFHQVGGDLHAYMAHLVNACAFVVARSKAAYEATPEEKRAIAYADRYGGLGIGQNGGSGRAVVLNGYHIKGVGRTGLISALTDEMHASGGAYLEECVREAICSEIIAHEFPHGAIPTLAIIDTGLVQKWNDPTKPVERRVLMVRPVMVRPAHFMRAENFISNNVNEGSIDTQRVRSNFSNAALIFGTESVLFSLERFLSAWARQLAYSYVHRVSVGGHSTSNICLDGALLDFGGCAALPSWAKILMMPGAHPVGEEMKTLGEGAQSLIYYFSKYFDSRTGTQDAVTRLFSSASLSYKTAIEVEMLKLSGLDREQIKVCIAKNGDGMAIMLAIKKAMSYYRHERLDILEFTPLPRKKWDFQDLWSNFPPAHLLELRNFICEAIPDISIEIARKRCNFISRTRYGMFRDEMKYRLYRQLETGEMSRAELEPVLAKIICREVAYSRRDTRCKLHPAYILVGFANSCEFSAVVVREITTGREFSQFEWATPRFMQKFDQPATSSYVNVAEGRLYKLLKCNSDSLQFDDGNQLQVACQVSLIEEVM